MNDEYESLKSVLPLLDLMHRFLLPRVSGHMASVLKEHGAGRILDVACGTGYTACALKRRGFDVVGVDLSAAMLSVASQKAGGCSFVRGDGSLLPFKERTFDGAVISLALHEISPPLRERVWAGMKRAVIPGGRLFVLDFARLPAKRSLYSRAVSLTILAIEKSTLRYDPDHWRNSMDFQQMGGLKGWLEEVGGDITETHAYLGGNIILAVVKN